MSDMTNGTDVVLATENLPAVFGATEKVDAILDQIAAAARDRVKDPDLSTATGRKAVASAAYWVARSKTALMDAGLKLTEDMREAIKAVNAERTRIETFCDDLKAEVRRPLTEWETAEAARIDALDARLQDLSLRVAHDHCWTAASIADEIKRVEGIPIDATWQEYTDRAGIAKDATLRALREKHAATVEREAEQAELARLRAEAAARAEEDARRERERLAAEAQARAEQAEKERLARIEQARAEAVEAARKEAERAAAAKIAEAEAAARRAVEEAAAAARKAQEDQARAVEAERLRAAAEREREAAAQAKRDANKRLRAKAKKEIADAIDEILVDVPGADLIADALLDGKIPHVEVRL